VRHERLDEELTQDALHVLDLLNLSGALSNPGLRLSPGLVQGQEAALASPLDQLVGLCYELGAVLEQPRVGDLGLVQDILHSCVLWEVQGSEPRGSVVLGWLRQRGGLDDWGAGEVVVEDGLAIGLGDGLCGHFEARTRYVIVALCCKSYPPMDYRTHSRKASKELVIRAFALIS
jgi:hypothetical protein